MRKHNFVVGYSGEHQCIYGKQENEYQQHIDPLTLREAKKLQKKIFSNYKRRKICSVIYKLVEVSND